jgi:RDD family
MSTTEPSSKIPRALRGDRDLITAEDLSVAPELLGLPLARPWRRLAAVVADVIFVAIISALANGWLLLVTLLGAVMQALAQWRGQALSRWKLALLGALFVLAFWTIVEGHGARGTDPYRSLQKKVGQAANAVADAGRGHSAQSLPQLSSRIEALENELARLQKTGGARVQEEVNRWLDDAGISFGWALLYFTFLPAWLRGQTLGKKLLGIRVVALTGKPLGLMTNLRRYGGYAAGMATGGLGFAQIFWDTNRQALQDKAAHTVVVEQAGIRQAQMRS